MPEPDDVASEAYSHELTSVGFWPGNRDAPELLLYPNPTPDEFSNTAVKPDKAAWLDDLGECALP